MSTLNECVICMENVETGFNCVVTECGHHFHTICLMTNVAHNGFACPYCRTSMAAVPRDDDESLTSLDSVETDEEDTYSEYALRGLRLFNNNLDGEEHDTEDIEDEFAVEMANAANPSAAFITDKLAEQNVTMEDLVKCLLLEHEEYDGEEIEFTRLDDDIYDKFSEIIKNYKYGGTTDTIPIEEPEPVAEILVPESYHPQEIGQQLERAPYGVLTMTGAGVSQIQTVGRILGGLQLPEQVVFQLQGRPVVAGEISLIV